MSVSPWVKWYAGDFLNGIADLNPQEIAVYAVVLNRIYDAGEPIPDDVAKIARRCNMRPTSCAKALDALVAMDKLQRRGGLITNRRAEKEIKSRQEVSKKSAQSATTRWSKVDQNGNKNNAETMRTQCERIENAYAYQKPDTREETSSNEDVGTPPKKPTPRQHLETVLDAEHAEAVIDHRKRKRAPLTARAAELLAGKFARCPDPNAAADAMIAAGWQGFEPEWLERRCEVRGHGPPAESGWARQMRAFDEVFDERSDQAATTGVVLSLPGPRAQRQ